MDKITGFTTASQITSGGPYKYEDTLPINAFNSSVWLVKFEQGQQMLQVWHKETKIEDIVLAVKMEFATGPKFTVSAVDVGTFWLHSTKTSLTNGRMVNQDMEVVV